MSIETSLQGARLGMKSGPPPDSQGTGFARMGAPIGFKPRSVAYDHLKQMGMTDREAMQACINGAADQLERDEPYRAMEHVCKYLDYTGACRIVAVLLCAENDA